MRLHTLSFTCVQVYDNFKTNLYHLNRNVHSLLGFLYQITIILQIIPTQFLLKPYIEVNIKVKILSFKSNLSTKEELR